MIKKLKNKIDNYIKKIIKNYNDKHDEILYNRIDERLQALQALDYHFKSSGKIIILTRIKNKDFVKIIDTKPEMSLKEYREFTESIKNHYGAELEYADLPFGRDKNIFKGIYKWNS